MATIITDAPRGNGSITVNRPSIRTGAPMPKTNAPAKIATGPKVAKPSAPKTTTPRSRAPRVSNPLLDPNQTLSGKNLYNAAVQLADAQTQPTISALQSQIKQNNANVQGEQNTDFGYYLQMAKDAQDAVNQSQQIGSNLQSTLQGTSAQTQQGLQGISNQFQTGGPLANMNAQGLAGSSLADMQAASAQQQGFALQNAQAAQNFGAQQSAALEGQANQGRLAQDREATDAISALGRAGQISNEGLNSKIAAEQEKRGALIGTSLGQLRAAERNYQVAQAGLGIKSATLQNAINRTNVTAQNDLANQKLKASALSIQQQNDLTNQLLKGKQLSVQQQNDLANQTLHASQLAEKTQNDQASQALKQAALNLKASQTGLTKPLPQDQQNTIYRNIDEMSTLIQQAQKAGESAQTIKNALLLGRMQKGFPAQSALFIEAAYELLGWQGQVLPSTAKLLRAAGLRGGTWNGKPITVRQPQGSNPLMPPGTGTVLAPGSTGLPGGL